MAVQTATLGRLGHEDVLIRVAGSGLCHTDLVMCDTAATAFAPAILGHEGAGVVVDVGPGVLEWRPGDRVVASYSACGDCQSCRRSQPFHCHRFSELNTDPARRRSSSGITDESGSVVYSSFFGQSSLADYMVVRGGNLVRVPDDVPLELAGPLGCGLLTGAGAVLNGLKLEAGEGLAILGVGAVGLAAVMAARVVGAETIVVIDRDEARLQLAVELGATHVVDTTQIEVMEALEAFDVQVDASLDTTGVQHLMSAAVTMLPPGGRCGLVAVGDLIQFNPLELVLGRSVIGIVEGNARPHVLIPLLFEWWRRGDFPFEKLIRTYPLGDIECAVADARSGVAIKPVLIPEKP